MKKKRQKGKGDDLANNLKDQWWRLCNLYWIMDQQGHAIRFRPNRIQSKLYADLHWLNLVLKSRQHGITTLVSLLFLDFCLFTPNARAGIIAHKLTDAKRIFRDKVKFAYERLPATLRKAMPLVKDEAQEIIFGHNNSGIYVGTTMHSATYQLLHITEYGWMCQHATHRAEEVKSALETVHRGGIVIIESTAEGAGDDWQTMCNVAEKKRDAGQELNYLDYKFHFFPWYLKESNQVGSGGDIRDDMLEYFHKVERQTGDTIDTPYRFWYVKKRETLKEKIYSQHPSTPEEAFYASVEGRFYNRQIIQAREQGRIGELPYEPDLPVHTAWDLGDMHTAIWFFQFVEDWIHWIDYYQDDEGLGLKAYAKVLQTKEYLYGDHFIGSDFFTSNAKRNGIILKDQAASLGIKFRMIPPHYRHERIEAVRRNLHKCKWDKILCEFGIRGLTNYRKEKNDLASTDDMTVYREIPVHDGASHTADAFGHGIMAYKGLPINGRIHGARRSRSGRRVLQMADMGVSDELMRV